MSQETKEYPQRENDQRQLYRMPIAALERGILIAVEAIENTGIALDLLRAGELDEFIVGVPDERVRNARRSIVTPWGIDLRKSLETIDRIGATVIVGEEQQLPAAYARLQMLVGEWQRRMIERPEMEREIAARKASIIKPHGPLKEKYVQQLDAQLVRQYPTRDITELVRIPVQKVTETVEPPTSEKDTPTEDILPIPTTRLQSLLAFVTHAQFNKLGELTMTSGEIGRLITASGSGKSRIPGPITEPLGVMKKRGGVEVPLGAYQAHRALRAALNKFGEKVAKQSQLATVEATLLNAMKDFTGITIETDAIAEMQRRLEVFFEKAERINEAQLVEREGVKQLSVEEGMQIIVAGGSVVIPYEDVDMLEQLFLDYKRAAAADSIQKIEIVIGIKHNDTTGGGIITINKKS